MNCNVEDCERANHSKGFCEMHYRRVRRTGNAGRATPMQESRRRPVGSDEDRFLERIECSSDGCWRWTRGKLANGYAEFQAEGRTVLAHRWAYAHFVGAIPAGLFIDHLCRVRDCVNPLHLEAVTNKENILRGTGFSARNARKTHCTRGHEFTPENIVARKRGGRECRICRDAYNRAYVRKENR